MSVYGLIGFAMLAATAGTDTDTVKIHTDSPFYVTGGQLLDMCSADEKVSNGKEVCADYIGGVIDTIVANRDTIQGYQICWPKGGLDLSTYRDMVVAYMRKHPEYSDGNGASVIDTMLFEAYPCAGAKPPPADQFLHKN